MKGKLGAGTKLLLLLAAAGLVVVLFLPIWRIDLDAPQYPEGLSLSIHANGLKGNVDIINGLNHYIGMKTLHNEDFFEFTALPYLIIFFAAAFALVALMNSRRWLNILFGAFVLFGIVAMYDFWRWEYDYGHNLNPNAAIVVPGMAYQPPLIGFKQLLNFGAYSIPDTGGWIFIGAGVLLLLCVVLEWKRYKLAKKKFSTANAAVLLLFPFLLTSCNTGPEAIVAGTDNCYFCKMAITDTKYGAEIVTGRGKIYKFDDLHCLLAFTKAKMIEREQVKDIYLADFTGAHSLVKASESFLLQGDAIHGPMNGNVIAFKDKDSLKKIAIQFNASEISWQQLNK
ncbi:MAG: nitrous oxide reductase accessory protein NosL [Chitinophagaceae bacterium]|nr:nitrous oxide reductase accessory protein NosL [Chitinophagaceae bacterium]